MAPPESCPARLGSRPDRECGRQESNLPGPSDSALENKGISSADSERVPDFVPTDPELAEVVQRWAELPSHIQSAVLALVRAGSGLR